MGGRGAGSATSSTVAAGISASTPYGSVGNIVVGTYEEAKGIAKSYAQKEYNYGEERDYYEHVRNSFITNDDYLHELSNDIASQYDITDASSRSEIYMSAHNLAYSLVANSNMKVMNNIRDGVGSMRRSYWSTNSRRN